ncbi:hypothetical protein BCR39DRAFT_517517 [Naematelia encephala]|uniref:Uncharacterized protein n=1 Tax=Naematelia encephala TaxID=71784 RepID=A0A1Y2BHP2_9TREE|nr:hypothetical protein BCR39DRAFT_517517 [Naematelia encephala]
MSSSAIASSLPADGAAPSASAIDASASDPPNNDPSPSTLADASKSATSYAEVAKIAPSGAATDAMIDPDLVNLPPPARNGINNSSSTATPRDSNSQMTITESIARAPNPRTTDFQISNINNEGWIDVDVIEQANAAAAEDDVPGSPTAKIMRAIAPSNATQPETKWPAPPQNASVNLFIGRALLANGNDNWPLKPNDIVNWIRKHYPAEWDGDEGRCSAHRVRTYLARKGADMYYEKLNQGCIAGWRIRQNHLWRFENGGFQGRGMKQEEAIAQAQKDQEAIATAAHKAAAAEALAVGHPGVKVSMSAPGISEGGPPMKRARIPRAPGRSGQANRRRTKPEPIDGVDAPMHTDLGDSSYFVHENGDLTQPNFSHTPQPGPSSSSLDIDPSLSHNGSSQVDMNMVQQAMQAAAGQMDELDMGIQLPIEMQMHGGEHDDDRAYQGRDYGFTNASDGDADGTQHPYTPHGQASYTYGGEVYGQAGYQQNGQ